MKNNPKKDTRNYYTSLQLISLKLDGKNPENYIITLPVYSIINIVFNKHPISWELIHRWLLNTSDSVMKTMWHNKTITGIPKNFPNHINEAPCTVCVIAKITIFPKVKTVGTINLWQGELLHVYFALYNVASVRGLTSIINEVCADATILLIFPTEYKQNPFIIFRFILTKLNN